jgi:hypothetical protein
MAGVGARTAAKKASPAKAAPKGRTAVADEEPDLLADLTDEKPAARADDSEEVIDLLDGLTEDNGIPWIPDDEDDPSPAGIQGKVTFRGTVASDYGPAEVPLIELTAADGTVWSIRGYATALRNQIEKADPQIGDLMAAKYFGVKTSKGNREYKDYKVVSRSV